MASEEKTLPQFKNGKHTRLVVGTGVKKRTHWKLTVMGLVTACILFKYTTFFVYRDQPQANRLLAWPHHPPPQVAEQAFLEIPNSESARRASKKFGTHPHLAGSAADFEDAKAILSLFQTEFQIPVPHQAPIFPAGTKESRDATLKLSSGDAPKGPTAWIDVYYPKLDTPSHHSLSIINNEGVVEWEADLEEAGDPRDPDTYIYHDIVPAWHGLSKDGDATGELIYANYGNQSDYAELARMGTNLTDKIVLTRYGNRIFRGLKIKGAEDLGAVGVLIYSDPCDDGTVTVANGYAPYPEGPARNPTSVERGSVEYLSIYPGDPTTPGYPSYENTHREEPSNVPSIPSLPISWNNAERLLKEIPSVYSEDKPCEKKLNGKTSLKKARVVNNVNSKVTPIWNTMGAIPGYIKDEVVIIGCHRDAWVMGAADPISGTVSLHEIVRGLGSLLKLGWKPLRTIVIASWDGEEYGLVGSTEWVEDFAEWIGANVVAYLNVDISVRGSRWFAEASPSLAHLIRDIAQSLQHPTSPNKTLWSARKDKGPFKGDNSTLGEEFLATHDGGEVELSSYKTEVGPLGSGSDFTAFLQYLGVASADQGFASSTSDPVYHYHSLYDTKRWLEVYGDPGFQRHVTVARHLGVMGLRLSDSFLIPLNTTQYALQLSEYLNEVEKLNGTLPDFYALREAISNVQAASAKLDKEKKEALEGFKKLFTDLPPYPSVLFLDHRGRLHTSKSFTFGRRAIGWARSVFGFPPAIVTAASLDVAQLFGDDTWESILTYVCDTPGEGLAEDELFPPWLPEPVRRFIEATRRLRRSNKKLIAFERGFISKEGIKDREWYKHLVVAPGKWQGYGATTMPALTEAIVEGDPNRAKREAARLTDLFNKLAETITP